MVKFKRVATASTTSAKRILAQSIIALAAVVLLPGCYESSSDLIGSHGTRVKRFDSLVVSDGLIYYLVTNGNATTACPVATKQDFQKPCKGGMDVKFERTAFGNYIVQIKDTKRYRFGLWMRSEKTPSSRTNACMYWLGDGAVGITDNDLGVMKIKYGADPGFQKLVHELRDVSTEALIDREQLLDIVSVYERTFYFPGKEIICINERIHISGTNIELDGDNRHLKDYD